MKKSGLKSKSQESTADGVSESKFTKPEVSLNKESHKFVLQWSDINFKLNAQK